MVVVEKKGANLDVPVTKVLYIETAEGLEHLGIVVCVQERFSGSASHAILF